MTNKTNKPKNNVTTKPKSKAKKKPVDASRATIIAAVLGLVGVTVGAIFTYWSVQTQVYAPIQATQTAQTFFFTQTALALNSNPQVQASPTTAAVISNPIVEASPTQPQLSVDLTVPTFNDINLVPTIYIGYTDIKTPEKRSYTVKVSRKQTYLWSYLWCAKYSGALDDNLSKLKFSFFIDEVPIPESNFLVFRDPSAENWYCQKWTTMLSGWDSNPPTLSVLYEIPTPITDGVTIFPIGNYGHEIFVTYVD